MGAILTAMGPGWGWRRWPAGAGGPGESGGLSRRPTGAGPAFAAALLVIGCIGGLAADAGGGSPRAGGPAVSATVLSAAVLSTTVRAAAAGTAVVNESTPGALSVGVSRALLDAAPVVVVADAGDRSGIVTAAAQAQRLSVPLLLAERASRSSMRASSLSALSRSSPGELLAEIRRLRPQAVLAVGSAVAARVGTTPDVRVVTDPTALPETRPLPRRADLVVLVRTGGDAATRAGAAAAAATARAAGAGVVPVRGGDPRADPSAIAALAKRPPRRVLAAGAGFGPADLLAARVAVAATGKQLPGGGQVVFPGRRLVALYGHPGAAALGVLGEQGTAASIARARAVAAPYRRLSRVPVVPAFEIIVTVATGTPGSGGNYSFESSVASLRPWVEKAGAAGMYVVLDLQPGRSDFLSQAKLYTPLLRLPYVGLALDPEWRLAPDQRPLQQIGSVTAQEINTVSAWLAQLTAAEHLPQKLLVLHQFRLSMIRDPRALDTRHDELAMIVHMDGQGPPSSKDDTWRTITAAAPSGVPFGWKNFYDEDEPTLTPRQTMSKRPTPVMISYQ